MNDTPNGIAAQLAQMVHELTPAALGVWKTGVEVYQINAIASLGRGFVALLILTGVLFALRKIYIREGKADLRLGLFIFSMILTFIAVVSFGFALTLFNIWSWIALVHPQLYAAHEVMNSVMRKR